MSLDHNQESYDAERIAFLALSAIKGVGSETLRRIFVAQKSFRGIFELDDADTVRALLGRSDMQGSTDGERAWEETRKRAKESGERRYLELQASDVSIVFQGDKDYPARLLDLKDPPDWLFVQGQLSVLSAPSISVVGSRKASRDGLWLTEYVGHWLSEFGAVTVSGLADGVDQVVHSASVNARVPTIAFLGTGIFTEYPKGSDALRQKIVDHGGAIVTEYLIKDGYSASNFVRRNRLQAALGKLLIPTEWAVKSGTAHTVRFAHELSRPIAFVRTPNQPDFGWIPREYVSANGFFTLPIEQNRFVDFVLRSLAMDTKAKVEQLTLI